MILKYLRYKLYSWTIGAAHTSAEYIKQNGLEKTIFYNTYNGDDRPTLTQLIALVLLIPGIFWFTGYLLYSLMRDAVKEDYNQFKEQQK